MVWLHGDFLTQTPAKAKGQAHGPGLSSCTMNALDRERLLDIEFFIWESLKRLLVGEGSR